MSGSMSQDPGIRVELIDYSKLRREGVCGSRERFDDELQGVQSVR